MLQTVCSSGPEETRALGEKIGALARPGDIIALMGELGAGKTQFAKGMAAGLGVDPAIPVTSPTYTLLNIYPGRIPFYHFDLYRLSGGEDVESLGFEEYLYGNGVSVIEWAQRLQDAMPEEHLEITFTHSVENLRTISFVAFGTRAEEMIACLFNDKKML